MNTYNHTPVLALTANTMKEYEERCFKRYMNGFLAKPFNKDDWQKEVHATYEFGAVPNIRSVDLILPTL